MNFDEIRIVLNQEKVNIEIPSSIRNLQESKLPIQVIRRRMLIEITALLIAILVSFSAPFFVELEPFAEKVYFVSILLGAVINLGYIWKMNQFLKKTNQMTVNTKDAIQQYIYDLKLTLKIYKTASFFGSLFLLIGAVAIYIGKTKGGEILYNWMTLTISISNILILLLGIMISVFSIYALVSFCTNQLYGKYLAKLTGILKTFEEK